MQFAHLVLREWAQRLTLRTFLSESALFIVCLDDSRGGGTQGRRSFLERSAAAAVGESGNRGNPTENGHIRKKERKLVVLRRYGVFY